ncbi:MAG: AI-2E family transporter [Pseudomarimonas sp.]
MTDTQKWQLVALTLLLGGVTYLLAPILTPFAAAALLAYLGDPLVDRLEARKLSRTAAVCVVFSLMTLAIVLFVVLLVPMVERQVSSFIDRLPVYLAWGQDTVLPWIKARTGFDIEGIEVTSLVDLLKEHWKQAGGFATAVLGGLSKSGLAVVLFLTNLLLVPVVTFYLLRDWDVLVARIDQLLPRAIQPVIHRLAVQSDAVLSSFLRGQLSVMLALGAIYSIGLTLVGVDLALLIGMSAGLVSFIPYLGGIVGVAAALIATLVQHGDWLHVGLVLAVFAVGQTLEGFVLTPWLVGDRIGMHPVAVIFAIMAGGQLFGFLGVLLALPVAAIVMVLLRYALEQYRHSELYGAAVPVLTAGDLGPAANPDATSPEPSVAVAVETRVGMPPNAA